MAFGGGPDFKQTLETQGEVSAPARSAWVSANAGSGKTHVLIQRVTRLLLARTAPSKIVCITYTKAAAAEMAERLFGQLGEWALMPDGTLREALAKVVGETEAREAALGEARKLFARALETPGGLKIQTIHSFCEMVLRRFPAEAGLLPGFTVMEGADATAALSRIVERLAEEALAADEKLLAAFDRLGTEYSPGQPGGFQLTLQGLLMGFAGKRGRILEAHRRAGGLDAFCADLRARCGLSPADDEEAVEARALAALDKVFLREVAQQFAGGGATAQKISAQTAAFLETGQFCDLEALVLTKDKKPRSTGKFGKESKARVAAFEERWAALCAVALSGIELRQAVSFCRLNEALHRLGAEVCARFEAYKAYTGLLDFEDLIERTVRLMADTSNAWVLYKLDQGVEHVLLDEAQDTGALQWEVIERLTEEFFVGEGTAETPRTLFVVGDEKQSIYSFQGADADLFHQKREALKGRAAQGLVDKSLGLSFRSTAPVLDFVDTAMTAADGAPLLGQDYQPHSTRHEGLHGRVELWPLIEKGEGTKGVPWDLPVDAPGEADPRRRLAASIAAEIKGWVEGPEMLANPKRPVSYGDVLILCQTRGPQFQEIVRALAAGGIPCAGADKVRMKDDVAVRDLLALLRFAANEDDCLSLAELLKSPFWNIEEDELFTLAQGRKGRLWAEVLAEAEREGGLAEKCRLARDEIGAALQAGRRRGPFALLSAVLEGGAISGRRRIAARLGSVSDEAIGELLSEALAFELEHPRTIEGFLAHLEGFSGEVKKEQAGTGDAVRVMTVHGAKGLQAPIVILADAGDLKAPHRIFAQNPLVELGQENAAGAFVPEPGCLACVEPGMDKGPPAARAAKAYADGRRMEEYRRLFYVAATRAAERLYICGTARRNRKEDAAPQAADWHRLAELAFLRLGEKGHIAEIDDPMGGTRLRYEDGIFGEEKAAGAEERSVLPPPPPWVMVTTPPAEEAPRPLRPSAGADDRDESDGEDPEEDEGPAFPPKRPGDGSGPYVRGHALHRLLERLPELPREKWQPVGRALLARDAPSVPDEEREGWLAEALAVLQDPAFAAVFGPGSRAEVPLIGTVAGRPAEARIDRLLVTDDEVLIVDFKSNRPPPETPGGVPPRVLFQMAAYESLIREVYPGRRVRSALLWTFAPRLMPLPSDLLDGQLGKSGLQR